MLNFNQFEVLVYLESHQDGKITQRKLASALNVSLGTVNSVLADLEENGWMLSKNNEYTVTEKGYAELEPYRVKRAVFFAAGFGSRLVPITLNTPKPLIQVKGRRMIETLLDAVLAVGIEDIVIVRGYLKDTFDLLLSKYPMIRFVDNDFYNQANNISSAYLVRDLLKDAYVFESDLLLSDPSIIRKYEFDTHYKGIKKAVTDDWCFDTKGSNLKITGLAIGGRDVYQMVGVSYWDHEQGSRLEKDLDTVYNSPGGKEKYWDEVAGTVYIDNYDLRVHPISDGKIVEIDTFAELCEIDPVYNVK